MKLPMILLASIALFVAAGNASNGTKEGEPLNLDTNDTRTVVETNKMGLSNAEVRTKLGNALRVYYVVSKRDWTHKYSHVYGMDASGSIEWPVPGRTVKWKWVLRQGGLAVLTKPDGTAIHLAREK